MAKVLITRPEHDDTTYYLSHWSKQAINFAESKGIKVFDLNRENANKKKFEGILEKQKPDFVIVNGHGSSDTLGGHKDQILVQSHKDERILKGTIVYAHTCSAAKTLGPLAVAEGTTSFLGYDEDFIFFYDPKKITTPLQDPTARCFLEPSTEAISSLLKGNTIGEAQKRAKELFVKSINKMISTEASEEDVSMIRYLFWDMRHLILCGDKDAKI
ncbi:MAG: hypothetical protein QT08_C0020G0032 [archaeon GW2011_AR17]|nr:MAG: hypothetical protein QT08_C0020G0032 [archaeon GW2011_AR17]MBS3154047.1 hypothetical protein [Candidatus Woesearchaeota archaeon]HIH15563.1 hypothetical protein [Nanoarchaeota archaeon]HIH59105.1 hypothetical protein [Nanoarchaeota archaeon]HII14607.1 hypothetical protein [Nanoarchaeota archaeon]